MESLFSLIKCLNKSEFETVRSFYSLQSAGNREVEKTIALLDLLRKSESEPSKEESMLHVYGKTEDASFRQLKSRLSQRILDTIVSEVNLDKIDSVEQYDIMSIKLRKKISQVLYLYFTKGNIPVVYDLLNSVIKSGEEYCIYNVLLETLKLKKMLLSIRGTDAEIAETENKLNYYVRCDEARNKAVSYYFELIRKENQKASESREKVQEMLSTAISELSSLYKELKVPSVGYYLKSLEMAYHANEGNFEESKQKCLDQIDLLKSKEIYRKERVGMCYDNVGHFEVMSGRPADSIEFFRKAQTYYKVNSINFIVSKEQEFCAAFYCDNIVDAARLAEELLTHNAQDQGAFRHSKYMYYKAAVLFRKNDFTACQKIINQNLEISSDKGGWDIGTRILMIMCNIELQEHDLASLHIQALKKHIERTRKKEDLSERDVLIFKTLSALDKEGFQWTLLGPGSHLLLSQLSDSAGKACWKPFGPELIRFDEWMRMKINPRKVVKRIGESLDATVRVVYSEVKVR